MSNDKLTPTSYLVLGLIALLGRATSYDLKAMVGRSIGYFWTFPHSQLYAEPDRLVGMGLLYGYEVRIQAIDGGAVTIEALP